MSRLFLIFTVLLVLPACLKRQEPENARSARVNFDYLWNTLNERYSLFEYKQTDWDSVKRQYEPAIYEGMSEDSLFNTLAAMLNTLRDGHVNLVSPYQVSRYLPVFYQSPENFNREVIFREYLGDPLQQTGPFYHAWLGPDRNIAYLYYPSFTGSFSPDQLEWLVKKYGQARGVILDIRNNGGGSIDNMIRLAGVFADRERLAYTTRIRTGPGKEDFSAIEQLYIRPGAHRFLQPVVLLTNRNSYSASSFFSAALRAYPQVFQLGDTTGGGAGAPAGGELPNGWRFRYSVTQSITADGLNFEDGVPPDSVLDLDLQQILQGRDNLVEAGIVILK